MIIVVAPAPHLSALQSCKILAYKLCNNNNNTTARTCHLSWPAGSEWNLWWRGPVEWLWNLFGNCFNKINSAFHRYTVRAFVRTRQSIIPAKWQPEMATILPGNSLWSGSAEGRPSGRSKGKLSVVVFWFFCHPQHSWFSKRFMFNNRASVLVLPVCIRLLIANKPKNQGEKKRGENSEGYSAQDLAGYMYMYGKQ